MIRGIVLPLFIAAGTALAQDPADDHLHKVLDWQIEVAKQRLGTETIVFADCGEDPWQEVKKREVQSFLPVYAKKRRKVPGRIEGRVTAATEDGDIIMCVYTVSSVPDDWMKSL